MKRIVCNRCLLAALALMLALTTQNSLQAQQKKSVGPPTKQWNSTVDKAIRFLRSSQDENGGWSTKRSIGITGIVVTGLLRTGKVDENDPMIRKALKYIESLVNKEKGHIAGNGRVNLQNYVTCVNVMALVQADKADKYKGVVGDAVRFLKQLQWDDGEGKSQRSDFFGGAGYDSQSRPDLSNTQFFVEALREAGVPPTDPALKKALKFVSRCQNIKGETNDQPWADKINDGSFIYTTATGGVSKIKTTPGGARPGYGSMTYAGVKSLIYCGVGKDDIRIRRAFDWLSKNYTVKKNPGFPTPLDQQGLYYYYQTLAKTLTLMEVDYMVDPSNPKIKHDWRAELTAELARRQNENGSWINKTSRWFEADPNLVTAYSLLALSQCQPQAAKE